MNDKKHIVIVGGTSGLGLASAEYLLDKGYNVMVLGRNQPQTKKNLSFHQVDVTDELSLKAFFDENKRELIDLDDKDVGKIKIKKVLPGKKIKSVEVLVKITNNN